MNSGGNDDEHEFEDAQSKGRTRGRRIAEGLGDAVLGASGSIRETLRAVRTERDFQVMVRLNKESLRKLDDLVNCGLTSSRSETAAFLIAEGAKARADLYDKIAEQSEVIRKAREQMSRLLDEEPDTAPGETKG